MFKTLKLFFLILCIFINTNLSSAEQKIVYLNLDYIFQNSVPGKLILEGLDNKRKKNIEKFKLQENEFRQKEQDIINKKNRTKFTRGRKVKISGFKKAIITLKKGQSIDLTTGI